MRRAKGFLKNSLILTSTALLMRAVGVSFHVYLSNQIGAEGMGLYQLIFSVYSLSVTFATSGIHLATTRLVSEEEGIGSPFGARRAVRACLCYSLFFGTLAGGVLFWKAETIGRVLLGDERSVKALYAFSVSLPFLAMTAVFGGYFTAQRKVIKSASAQISEQMIRICASVVFLQRIGPKGLEYACLAVVGGGSLAEIFSFFYQFLLYRMDCKRKKEEKTKHRNIVRRMLSISVPVAVSAYARSFLNTAEHILIPVKLKMYGYSKEQALARYGVLHGMTLPVLFFPTAILTAFSSLLVPEMAEYRVRGEWNRIRTVMAQILQVTMLFSVAIGGIFFLYGDELGRLIYHRNEVGMYLKIFSPLVLVMYADGVVDAMLKGLNEQLSAMRYSVIDSLVSVLLVLVLIPKIGIGGYVAVIFVSESLNGFLSLNRLLSVTDFRFCFCDWLVKPCVAILIAGVLVKCSFSSCGDSAISLTVSVCATIFLYVLFLMISGALTREDCMRICGIFGKK